MAAHLSQASSVRASLAIRMGVPGTGDARSLMTLSWVRWSRSVRMAASGVLRRPKPSCFSSPKGLAGDSAAARASLEALESARATRSEAVSSVSKIVFTSVENGADSIIDSLAIARLKYPADEARVRWELNLWIVQSALERLDDRQLSAAEQREVWHATRTPHKVAWPQWWNYFGE